MTRSAGKPPILLVGILILVGSCLLLWTLFGSFDHLWLFIHGRDGMAVRRISPDRIVMIFEERIGNISIPYTLNRESRIWLGPMRVEEDFLPAAIATDTYWSWPLEDAMYGWRTYWVNPKLADAVNMIHYMWSTDEDTPEQIDEVHRICGAGYVYLGYAVRDMDDVRALSRARQVRPEFNTANDVTIDGRTIYRLSADVATRLAKDPQDEGELTKIRAATPVIVERANAAEGHPMDTVHVLYLDGSVVEIPFGERFPATQEFLDVLFPPNTDQSN